MENLNSYQQQEEEIPLGADQSPFVPEDLQEEQPQTVLGTVRELLTDIPYIVRTAVVGIGMALIAQQGMKRVAEHNDFTDGIEAVNKELAQLHTLDEKVARIKELFGDSFDLERYNNTESNLEERKSAIQEGLDNFSWISTNHVYVDSEPLEYAVDKKENLVDSIEFSSFGNTFDNDGNVIMTKNKVSYKHFMNFLNEKVFPKGALNGEVRYITQTNEEADIIKSEHENNPSAYSTTVASCTPYLSHENVITLYKFSKTIDQYEFMRTIAHEVGHANDWNSDNSLSLEARTDLLLAVANRVRAKDRYMSGYVESISNDDKKIELRNKCVEYWAEIYAKYIMNPQMLNYEDFKIVDAVVKKADPHYQPHIFSNQMETFYSSLKTLQYEK